MTTVAGAARHAVRQRVMDASATAAARSAALLRPPVAARIWSASTSSPSYTFSIGGPAICAGGCSMNCEFSRSISSLGRKVPRRHAVDDDRVDTRAAGLIDLRRLVCFEIVANAGQDVIEFCRFIDRDSAVDDALYKRFRSIVTSAGSSAAQHDRAGGSTSAVSVEGTSSSLRFRPIGLPSISSVRLSAF